ncbi:hypothetical protein ACOMCU_24975 [Lysinibacillus sp. UGB7]|uniref:hypothetical protein n=1 Tax=Lysinibacillus sp. UGB7 TaxID=3411039 RepID=UPI003B7B4F35
MNYFIYKIQGKHMETKRTRTLKINALNEDDAKQQALESGLESCTSMVIIPFDEPTQNQLDYARDLGIQIPAGLTKDDVSALISRKINGDEDYDQGLLEFATNHRIYVSKYIASSDLYGITFHKLSIVDRIAFFAFAIYRDITRDSHSNLDTHPARNKFYELAASKENDIQFIKSLDRYRSGKEIQHFGEITVIDSTGNWTSTAGSVDSIAYKNVRQYLIEQMLISESTPYRKKTIHKSSVTNTSTRTVSPSPVNNTKGKGCGAVAVLFLAISAVLGGIHFL